MKPTTEHTGACYEGKALKYAEAVDTKPWNACYERPGFLSLLPPLRDKKILDAGCGSGWYAEHLLDQGAVVTAFDLDPDFVKLARARVGSRAQVLQANLAEPLTFAGDGEFDLVICPLVMHYLKEWEPVLGEFHRLLKPAGIFVFSTHHPFTDWKYFQREDYFARELLEDEWDIGKMQFYRRPLTAMSKALDASGFFIERLLEPQPTENFQKLNPEGYEKRLKRPLFLVIRAKKRE